jgi:hypothetical protein
MLPDLDVEALSPASIRPAAAAGILWPSDRRTNAAELDIAVRPTQERRFVCWTGQTERRASTGAVVDVGFRSASGTSGEADTTSA